MVTHMVISKCFIYKNDNILVALEPYQNLAQLFLLKSDSGTLCTEHFCDSCDIIFHTSDTFYTSFDYTE